MYNKNVTYVYVYIYNYVYVYIYVWVMHSACTSGSPSGSAEQQFGPRLGQGPTGRPCPTYRSGSQTGGRRRGGGASSPGRTECAAPGPPPERRSRVKVYCNYVVFLAFPTWLDTSDLM